MDADAVTTAVHQVLARIQGAQKLNCPELSDNLKPLKDLERFDSPMSLAATGMIGRKLGLTIPPKTNVFGNKSGLFTLKQTVAFLCKLAEEQKKKETVKV